jgi:flagellar M-ring protein FliF
VNLDSLLARLRALGRTFTTAQLVSIGAAFVLVVAVVAGGAWWLNAPTYRLLFSDMDAESAAQVASRLRDQKVPYKLTDGGRAILVPDTQVDQLRLDFAAQGMPLSGRIGFEIFDRTQFGATEFLEQVNFRRALEGELARTIATLSEVSGARVHIAMAKTSLFGQREQPAKASVILKLRHNKPLPPQTIQGIASLVSAAVEGLRPEAVVIVDTFGRPLARPADDAGEPLGSVQIERQQRFERELAARVVALLEPVVGEGRVRVNVAARLHQDAEDRIEEQWDPNGVVRSRALTQESGGTALAQGIAGARANLPGAVPPGSNEPAPPVLAQATAAPAGTAVRSSETTNYEVSKVVRHTTRPRGDIARLSVAVLVDNEHIVTKNAQGTPARTTRPRDSAEMQKISALVASAVGLDPSRGDQLTVENIAFDEPVVEEPAAPGVLERYGQELNEILRVVAVLVLGGMAFFLLGRPLVRRVAVATPVEPAALPAQLPRTIADLEGEIEAQLEAQALSKVPDRRLPVLTKRLSAAAQREPEAAARLVRTWLLEDKQ